MDKSLSTHRYDDDTRLEQNSLEPKAGFHAADRITIGELARETGVTLRALRFYQSKGLLAPRRDGNARVFNSEDRTRLSLIQQGKRLGFTLCEIRTMMAAPACDDAKLSIGRKKCLEQIKLLERRRGDIELAIAELRQIYTAMFVALQAAGTAREPLAAAS